ncbi:hypothetical protein TPA0910_74290 [Streptomyces hygroscopicus subsp. sporocinereus]|uniref:Uncharacterized protein n=1 Tax=Streptomyces hygroscopicus TaxID=1912 RepID=A0ABQ3UBJ8_STRHY|nr:hypothetical protein TPA0910_74290 [Streptomyces hygroscopicus]
MRPRQIWDVFDWCQGACFRCEAVRVPVALVGEVTAHDETLPLYACHHCIFRMQQSHWFATGRRAWQLERLQLPPHGGSRRTRSLANRWLRHTKRSRYDMHVRRTGAGETSDRT